jgi:hypothetical protein
MPLLKYRQDGETVREYTADEYAQDELDQAQASAQADASAARAVAREALLARLGITADEAQLLLGGI